jgi:hypothetical protein
MAPTANLPNPSGPEPSPQKDDLERALGAASEAGAQEYQQGEINPDVQGEIAADDAGGTKMAQEIDREGRHANRERSLPKPPPDEASG